MSSDPHTGPVPQEPHGASVPRPHHRVNYYAIFGALVVLTFLTVAVSLHRFQSEVVNLAIAIAIAAAKASLVALFFMHLKFEGKLIYLIFVIPLSLCVVLTLALIPDIVMTVPGSHSGSLHLFNPINRMIQMAMGGQ